MSYEGHEEYLCPKGHRWTGPCTYGNGRPDPCPVCKAEPVWQHSINDTNCFAEGHVPEEEWARLQLTAEVTSTCNLGHVHLVEHATYREPTPTELREMEHIWDPDTKSYVRLNRT